jgi:hypothetical protein
MSRARTLLCGILRILKFLVAIFLFVVKYAVKFLFMALPAVLVYFVLTARPITIDGPKPVLHISDGSAVNELFPNTRWSMLRPCSAYFDEQEEFEKAVSCVNKNVWPKSKLPPIDVDGFHKEEIRIPRCFIVTADSPDLISPDGVANMRPVKMPDGKIGGVVGYFESVTETIFVVENYDAAMIYRHELQHFFLHVHDPMHSDGGGHDQDIWKKCEPPLYDSSDDAKLVGVLRRKRS